MSAALPQGAGALRPEGQAGARGGPGRRRARDPGGRVAPDLQTRARRALAARLRELLPAAAVHPDGGHAVQLAGALVRTLSAEDVAWARAQLAARAKGELRPTARGAVPAHAAWASSSLVSSAFGPWRHRPGELPLLGLGPFAALRLEERIPIPHGGGNPNLDVALDRPQAPLAGIESKLTEHLAAHRPRPWKPVYRRPAMAAALDAAWRAVFADLLDGTWAPRHLDAGQLVRHALSLRGEGDLVLLFWEPRNAGEHPEVLAHRAEVAALLGRLDGARPRLHARAWGDVLAGWQDAMPGHVAALRERYDVDVPPG